LICESLHSVHNASWTTHKFLQTNLLRGEQREPQEDSWKINFIWRKCYCAYRL